MTDPKGNVSVDAYQNLVRTSLTRGYGTPQAATWTFTTDVPTLGITKVVDPNGHTSSATYDRDGNRLSVTDGLTRTSSAAYNSFDEPVNLTDAKGVTTTMVYDSNANLLSIAELVDRYGGLPLGGTDASGSRHRRTPLGFTTIATLDRSHFSVVRPAHCDAFELVP